MNFFKICSKIFKKEVVNGQIIVIILFGILKNK